MISIKEYQFENKITTKINLTDEYGFIELTSGTINLTINNTKNSFSAKNYLILLPYDTLEITSQINTSFSIFRLKSTDLKRISNNNDLTSLFKCDKNNFNSRLFLATPYSESILESYIKAYHKLLKDKNNFNLLKLDAWTTLFLISLIELRFNNKNTKRSKLYVKDIIDYYRSEITNTSLSLSLIADHFNVTEQYLSKYYKKETGHNLNEDIIKYRLTLAIDYLNKGLSVVMVYQLVGFNTYNNFFKQFKKFYNMAPLQYLKELN